MHELSDEQISRIEKEAEAYQEWRQSFIDTIEKGHCSFIGDEAELQEQYLEGLSAQVAGKMYVVDAYAIDLT